MWLTSTGPGGFYDFCVYYMTGTPEGSSESGSGEAGNQTCNLWFTMHSTYPLHHNVILCEDLVLFALGLFSKIVMLFEFGLGLFGET